MNQRRSPTRFPTRRRGGGRGRRSPSPTRRSPIRRTQRENFPVARTDEEAAEYIKNNTEFRLPPNKTLLNLSNKNIKELPLWIGKLTNLEELYLSSNQLTSLPPDLFKDALPNLKVLYLSGNQLTSLPPDLFKDALPNLKVLYLSGNQLTSLPPDLFKNALPNLKVLHLAYNQLTSLPDSLTNKREINIYGMNEQRTLPQIIRSPSPIRQRRTQRQPTKRKTTKKTSPILENLECTNEEDPLYLEDFSKGAKEYEEESRVIILEPSKTNKGTCYEQRSLIKSLFQLYGENQGMPMAGPYPNKDKRVFKIPQGYWIDLEGVKLILEGFKVLRLKKVSDMKIGTHFGIGMTHGDEHPIFTLEKVRGFSDKNKFYMKVTFDRNLQVTKEQQFNFEGTEKEPLAIPKAKILTFT